MLPARPRALHDALRIETLSGPAQYVSGGAARIRVVVPAAVPLVEATVELNGVDVTSAFTPDDQAPHALEGVLTGLPLGPSSVEASVPGPGNSANDRATLTLVNYPITGPMFSGPEAAGLLLLDAGAIWPASTSPARSSTRTARWRQMSTTTTGPPTRPGRPFDPAAPRPADMTQTTTSDGDTVDFVIRWERGTINRFIYTIAVLDPTASGPSSLPNWNRKLIYYFGGGVAIGHYQGSNNQGESRYVYGLGQGYAIAWSTGTKTNTHYNLVLGGETALMVKSRFVTRVRRSRVHRRARRLRGRHPAVRLRPEPPGTARRRDPAVLLPGHGHADDPRRRLRAARALDGPESPGGGRRVEVAGVDEPLVAGGARDLEHHSEPVPAA